jgi:hypothetical protein
MTVRKNHEHLYYQTQALEDDHRDPIPVASDRHGMLAAVILGIWSVLMKSEQLNAAVE